MRNRHGRYVYALTELPMGYPGGEASPMLDVDVGDTLAFGADLRTVWLQQFTPTPTSTDEATTFRFDLPRDERVRLEVFDLLGRRVTTLRDTWMPAGRHALEWDRRDADGIPARPGVYLYRFVAGSYRAQRKLVVLP